MDEAQLHQHIYSRSAQLRQAFPGVLVGPGDDCAVLTGPSGPLLFKIDQLLEHRHFSSATPVDLIARKALNRTVSDIAAMGGEPLYTVIAAVFPPHYLHERELFDRLQYWAAHVRAPLVGGDVAVGAVVGGQLPALSLSVSMIGTPMSPRGPVLRSQAQIGDELWVTGRLGGSFGSGRHLTFEPRLEEARWLCTQLGQDLHAMMDISDGLGRDAARLGQASGVRVELEGTRMPLHDGVTVLAGASDGEDYELLFAAAPGAMSRHLVRSPRAMMFTHIGSITAGNGCVLHHGGLATDAENLGWNHQS